MRPIASIILITGAAALAAACYLAPALAALHDVLSVGDWSAAVISPRRWSLLWRGVRVAFEAALLAQALGAALAAGLAARGNSRLAAVSAWVGAAVLLTPPYLYAYAWSLVLLPAGVATGATFGTPVREWLLTEARAVWCLATWTAPLAAVVLHAGWRSAGRGAYVLASLDAGPIRALLRGAVAVMWPWLMLSALVVFTLALTEYSVCHLCLVQTWNTEVLAEVQQMAVPGQALLLAWPLLVLVGLLAALLWLTRRRIGAVLRDLGHAASDDDFGSAAASSRAALAWPILVIVALLLPWAIFAGSLGSGHAFIRTLQTYPHAWPIGLKWAAGSALTAAWIALGAEYLRGRSRYMAGAAGNRATGSATRCIADGVLVLALVAALAPPALVGDAFAAAYVHAPRMIDSGAAASLAAAARFGALALLALRLAMATAADELRDCAAVDGASWSGAFWRVLLPARGKLFAAVVVTVGLLSLGEVAASSLVRPHGTDNLALTMLNEIHFGRSDNVVALSLYFMAFVAVMAVALRRLAPLARPR